MALRENDKNDVVLIVIHNAEKMRMNMWQRLKKNNSFMNTMFL